MHYIGLTCGCKSFMRDCAAKLGRFSSDFALNFSRRPMSTRGLRRAGVEPANGLLPAVHRYQANWQFVFVRALPGVPKDAAEAKKHIIRGEAGRTAGNAMFLSFR
jgi:hypothetical protein